MADQATSDKIDQMILEEILEALEVGEALESAVDLEHARMADEGCPNEPE